MNMINSTSENTFSCGCVGPQNGEPLCPCQMRGVKIENGRYIKTIDLGPANNLSEIEKFYAEIVKKEFS